jgi:rare lipoprotein A
MKTLILCAAFSFVALVSSYANPSQPAGGYASWYGEDHRGRLMANGKKFDPDKLTAASWFYPLGTKVQVTTRNSSGHKRSVTVTVTDRGPAMDLVRGGRIIDLGHAAFKKLADPDQGLVAVKVQPLARTSRASRAVR